ncbi:hypothetical protein KO361_06190 [Candidatus Woesearchaeota archaeon]|nr:hypothetical protein [Candidatus Woesearchaeota archaeon]
MEKTETPRFPLIDMYKQDISITLNDLIKYVKNPINNMSEELRRNKDYEVLQNSTIKQLEKIVQQYDMKQNQELNCATFQGKRISTVINNYDRGLCEIISRVVGKGVTNFLQNNHVNGSTKYAAKNNKKVS